MILGGGLFHRPGVTTRELAAEEILEERARRLGRADIPAVADVPAATAPPPDQDGLAPTSALAPVP